jgi:hypothetical protein
VSRLDSTDRPTSAKQKPDIYFMMLVLSFLALVIGSICLFLEVKSYDMDIKATGAQVRAGQPPMFERPALDRATLRAVAMSQPADSAVDTTA